MVPAGSSSGRPISTASASKASITSTCAFIAAIGSRDARIDASAWPPRMRESTLRDV